MERVRAARPKRLLVIADAPRETHPNDAPLLAASKAIIDKVDWDCEVETNYAEQNMGPALRISSGLDWVFNRCDRAMIFEDDCLPSPDFFPFCEQMLERYAEDPRVMMVSGRSVYHEPPAHEYDYYFSRQLECWGWASWARAWKHYDYKLSLWPQTRDRQWLMNLLGDKRAVQFFYDTFDHHHDHNDAITSWDQQVNFMLFVQNGLGIRPYANLIEYIGFDEATHQFYWGDHRIAEKPIHELSFPLRHPPGLLMDTAADRHNYHHQFGSLARKQRIRRLRRPLGIAKRVLLRAKAGIGSAAMRAPAAMLAFGSWLTEAACLL